MTTDTTLRIVVGADHRGTDAAEDITRAIRQLGHEADIVGDCGQETSCDYPDKAWLVGRAVRGGEADAGVLICGTAIGMSIAANKIPGCRAAVVHDELTAELSRQHNDANIICLSGDLLGRQLMQKIIAKFLATGFEGGRHARRLAKIERIERGENPTAG